MGLNANGGPALRFFEIENGYIHEIGAEPGSWEEAASKAVWIDVHEPDQAEKSVLSKYFSAEIPGSGPVEEIQASARCYVDRAGTHINSLFLAPSGKGHATASVAFILRHDRLISHRGGEIESFSRLLARASKGQIAAGSAPELLVWILEQKVDDLADALEDIHKNLEEVSAMALRSKSAALDEAIRRLSRLEDSNGKIRLCLMDTQRDISFLVRSLPSGASLQETLREIMHDLDTLMSHANFLFDKINFLMSSTQGFINIRQNQIIKIFSIAAVLSLPPTLVASVYGMNFENMPELKWALGYPWALGLMIVSGVAPYLFFKRKGWL